MLVCIEIDQQKDKDHSDLGRTLIHKSAEPAIVCPGDGHFLRGYPVFPGTAVVTEVGANGHNWLWLGGHPGGDAPGVWCWFWAVQRAVVGSLREGA